MTNDSVSLLVLQPGGSNLWPDGSSRTGLDQGSGPRGGLTPGQVSRQLKARITVMIFNDQGHDDHHNDHEDHDDHEDHEDHHDHEDQDDQ